MKQYKDIITWEDKMESKAERIKQRTMKTIKRTWRPQTAVIAAFLMLTTLIPVLGGCSSPSSQEQQVPQVDQTPSTASLHEGEMDNLKALLANAGSLPPAELRAGLTAAKENLASLNSQMEEEFASTTEVLNRLDLPEKMQIHQEVMAQFQDSKDRLNTALDETIASTDADIAPRAASLYGLVSELSPEEESQPLGTELPNQLIERDPVAPVLGANIAPAYLAGAPDLTPSDLPVEPTEEDLAPTIDAQQSQEIIDKAAELENDAVKIYEWVRNNIDFEPYYGSKKGATETLAELAGNDMDTASLLIALYRVSGIPARYVTGVIEITADQAMKWTATEVPEAALRLFASGGTPITGIQEGSAITRFQLTHTYSEAYINYSNYRGAAGGSGPSKWIPLDSSFKDYTRITPLDTSQISYDYQAFMDQLMASSQITPDGAGITSIPQDQINQGSDQYVAELTQLLTSQGKEVNPLELTGRRYINKLELGLLSSALPFNTIQAESELFELDGASRYQVAIEMAGVAYNVSLPQINDKCISILYYADTDQDRAIIEQYKSIDLIPAYLTRFRPNLFFDEQPVAEGQAAYLGSPQTFEVEISAPGFSLDTSHFIFPGCSYALTLDPGGVSRSRLADHQARLDSALAVLSDWETNPESTQTFHPTALYGEMHNLTGLTYFIELDAASEVTAAMRSIRFLRFPSEALLGSKASIDYSFGVPIKVDPNSLFMDVGSLKELLISESGNRDEELACALNAGVLSSFLESESYVQNYDVPAVSSVELLMQAGAQGIPVYQITSENAANYIPGLPMDTRTKGSISSFIASGGIVIAPAQEVISGDWQGIFWIVLDPMTGSSGFYIEGGLCGSDTKSICGGVEVLLKGLQAAESVMRPFEETNLLSIIRFVGGDVVNISTIFSSIFWMQERVNSIRDLHLDPEDESMLVSIAEMVMKMTVALNTSMIIIRHVTTTMPYWAVAVSFLIGVILKAVNALLPYFVDIGILVAKT